MECLFSRQKARGRSFVDDLADEKGFFPHACPQPFVDRRAENPGKGKETTILAGYI